MQLSWHGCHHRPEHLVWPPGHIHCCPLTSTYAPLYEHAQTHKIQEESQSLGEKGRPSLLTRTMCKNVFTMVHFTHRSKTFRRKYRGKIFSESRHNFLHSALENDNWAWSKFKTQHCSENITTTKTTHYKKVLSIFIFNKGTVSKNMRNSQNSVKT